MKDPNNRRSAAPSTGAKQQSVTGTDGDNSSLLVLGLLSLLVGAAAGLVGAVFRLSLKQADQWRNALIAWANDEGLAGLALVIATCAAATAVAASIRRPFFPH